MTTEVSTSTTETPRSEMQRQHHHGDRHQPAFLLLAPEVHGGGQIRALLFKVHAASVIHQGARTHARSGQDHGRLLLPAVPTSQAGQSMDCFPLLQGQQQTTSIKVRCSCPHARMQDAASSTPLHGHLLSHYTIVDGQEKGFIMPCTSALASSAPAQRRWFFSASATEQPRCSFLGVVALLCFVAMNTPWVLLHLTSTRFQFGTTPSLIQTTRASDLDAAPSVRRRCSCQRPGRRHGCCSWSAPSPPGRRPQQARGLLLLCVACVHLSLPWKPGSMIRYGTGHEKGFIMPCTSASASSAPVQRRWFFSTSVTRQPRCPFLGVVALLCFVAMNTSWVLLHLSSTRIQFGTTPSPMQTTRASDLDTASSVRRRCSLFATKTAMMPATRTTPWMLLVVCSFPTRTTPTASSRSAPSLRGLCTPLPPMEAWKDSVWYSTSTEPMQTTRTSACQAPWRCCFCATAAALLFCIGYKNSHGLWEDDTQTSSTRGRPERSFFLNLCNQDASRRGGRIEDTIVAMLPGHPRDQQRRGCTISLYSE